MNTVLDESNDSVHRIIIEPGRRSGRAVVRGTRITVADILSMLAAGMSIDDLLQDFAELEHEDIAAALGHAAVLEGMTHKTGRAA